MLKKMLITGAGGMVGRQAAEHFSKEYAVTALTKTELSITELENVKRIFQTVKPDIVVNCAVIRNDRCSQNEQLARRVNVEGVRNLAVFLGFCVRDAHKYRLSRYIPVRVCLRILRPSTRLVKHKPRRL